MSYKVKFSFEYGGETIRAVARAGDVDSYGALDLRFKFSDDAGEPIELLYNKGLFETLEETATNLLYEKKYANELDFA